MTLFIFPRTFDGDGCPGVHGIEGPPCLFFGLMDILGEGEDGNRLRNRSSGLKLINSPEPSCLTTGLGNFHTFFLAEDNGFGLETQIKGTRNQGGRHHAIGFRG
jgi:hypothetical protein